MTVSVPLPPKEEAKLLAFSRATGMSPEAVVREALGRFLAESNSVSVSVEPPNRPSSLGALSHLGQAPSADVIDENRVEMFSGFGQDDIA